MHFVFEIVARQAEFVDVRVIGEFEEAEWVVEPPRGPSHGPA